MVMFLLRSVAAIFLATLAVGLTARADEVVGKKPGRLEVKHVGANDEVTVETPSVEPSPAPLSAAGANKKEESQGAAAPATASSDGKAWKKSKLIPFPEDEPRVPAQQNARPMPATKLVETAPTGKFQPRFRPPGVKQAQHTEPARQVEPAVQQVQHVEPLAEIPQADGTGGDKAEPVADAETAPARLAAVETTGETQPLPLPEDATGRAVVDHAFAKSKAARSDADFSQVIDLCRRGMHDELSEGYEAYTRRLMGWAYNRRGE